jgi:SAM-dependent methyltransferase
MSNWDERFRAGEYPQDPEPDPLLERAVDAFPEGRALDVATGTGRNAVFLATEGYRVDALDQSRAGLAVTRENARERGVADRLELVQTDVPSHGFPESTYAVITISFYRAIDRLSDITAALEPGGYLFVQHHLRSSDPVEVGPSSDRYRFAANELLRACLGLTILYYDERTERRDGRQGATVRVLARNSTGQRQSYPEIPSA